MGAGAGEGVSDPLALLKAKAHRPATLADPAVRDPLHPAAMVRRVDGAWEATYPDGSYQVIQAHEVRVNASYMGGIMDSDAAYRLARAYARLRRGQ